MRMLVKKIIGIMLTLTMLFSSVVYVDAETMVGNAEKSTDYNISTTNASDVTYEDVYQDTYSDTEDNKTDDNNPDNVSAKAKNEDNINNSDEESDNVEADGTVEELNNLPVYNLGETFNFEFSNEPKQIAKSLTMENSGVVKFEISYTSNPGNNGGVRFTVWNMKEEAIYAEDYYSTGTMSLGLLKGKYWIWVSADRWTNGTGTYKGTLVSSDKNFQTFEEGYDDYGQIQYINNTKETATNLSSKTISPCHGLLSPENKEDWYKITIEKGTADLSFISGDYFYYDYWANAPLYDSEGSLICYMNGGGNVESNKTYSRVIGKGTYYLEVCGSWSKSSLSYSISLTPRYRATCASIDELSYNFKNFSDPASLDLFYYTFGNHSFAKNIHDSGVAYGGNCFGMSTTAGMLFVPHNGVNVNDFRNSSNIVYDLEKEDSHNMWEYKTEKGERKLFNIKSFIQTMMIAQFSPSVSKNLQTIVRNPYDLYKKVDQEVKSGKPVKIGIRGVYYNKYYNKFNAGHALLAYGVEDTSDNVKRILVYDCNKPYDDRKPYEENYIKLSKETGKDTSWTWTYELDEGVTWGTKGENNELNYMTYDSYQELFRNIGHLADNSISSFITSEDVNIYSGNTCIATVRDGNLETSNENIWISKPEGVLFNNDAIDKIAEIYLPVGNYTIERFYQDHYKWKIYFSNVDLGGSVNSAANKISFIADDNKGITQVLFDEGSRGDFEVELNSSKPNESSVIVKGSCDKTNGLIKLQNGEVETKNVKVEEIREPGKQTDISKAIVKSATYNGKEQIPTVTYNGIELTVNTDYTWEKANKSKTYKNAGKYEIILTGKGKFTGTSKKMFTITAKSITPAVTLAKKEYTYNGKAKKPSVTVRVGKNKLKSSDYSLSYASGRKKVGSYKVTIKLKGNYRGKKTVTFKIVPKGTNLNKPKAEKKAIKVSWKKQTAKMNKSRITGYEIQVATDKNFTKNKKTVTAKGYKTSSKKITKLKGGKKYFVRIRTYMTVSGKKYYSPWSKAVSVKTKK